MHHHMRHHMHHRMRHRTHYRMLPLRSLCHRTLHLRMRHLIPSMVAGSLLSESSNLWKLRS